MACGAVQLSIKRRRLGSLRFKAGALWLWSRWCIVLWLWLEIGNGHCILATFDSRYVRHGICLNHEVHKDKLIGRSRLHLYNWASTRTTIVQTVNCPIPRCTCPVWFAFQTALRLFYHESSPKQSWMVVPQPQSYRRPPPAVCLACLVSWSKWVEICMLDPSYEEAVRAAYVVCLD